MSKSDKLDRVLNLLSELENLGSEGAKRDDIRTELISLVRQAGAGGRGKRGDAYTIMKDDIESDPLRKQALIDFLNSKTPLARSWSGSFVEQLLSREESIPLLKEALRKENDSEAVSWMAMNLGRITQGEREPEICTLIDQAYEKVKGDSQALQTARAWGYAGCEKAAPILRQALLNGGHDQMIAAVDGLVMIVARDRAEDADIQAIWETFLSVKWSDVRGQCSDVLSYAEGNQRVNVINKLLGVISDATFTEEQRNSSAETLSKIQIPRELLPECLTKLIEALKIGNANLNSIIVNILDKSINGWEETFVDLIIQSEDGQLRSSLARALAVNLKSREKAVELLNSRVNEEDPEVRQRITNALTEMGGAEAFESLQSLLQIRYIEPSEELQKITGQVFEETVARMKGNYDTSIWMNKVVFFLGVLVVISGIVIEILAPSGNRFFGTAGIVAGLGTLVSLFFFGPLKRIQQAMTELVEIEVAFTSYMHRILQARSIFEQLYISRKVDLNTLSQFDTLINESMTQTIKLLERSKRNVDSKKEITTDDVN